MSAQSAPGLWSASHDPEKQGLPDMRLADLKNCGLHMGQSKAFREADEKLKII